MRERGENVEYKEPTFVLFGLEFSYTIVFMVTVTAVITFLIAYLGARNAHTGKPTGMQSFMEWVIDFIRNQASNVMEYRSNQLIFLALAFIMFIFVGNMLSIPFKITTTNDYILWKAPTSDPHVTLTLSLTVIVLCNIIGIRLVGIKEYFLHWVRPLWQLPLHIVEEFAKTLTLGLRLFGNIFAKETLASLLSHAGSASILGAVLVAVPTIAWHAFGIFVGAIQAFVFTILTLSYIASKIETNH